jgi:PilZ domain-containing protein
MLNDPKRGESNSAGVAPQEQRASPRYAFSAAAEAVHSQTDTRLNGRISDVGRGGCYVDTINPFPVGAEVKIRINKDNASFVAQGRVVYATGGMGMALMFTKIEPERLQVLEKWLAELRGEVSPEADALERDEPEHVEEKVNGEHSYVLNELIIALMRKRVLTDAEGKAMLQKLLR